MEQKGNRVKKERKRGEKEEIINAAATGNRTRDLSITDQMDVLTNQVHLKIHFRHRFDQKCPFTDSVLASLEKIRQFLVIFKHCASSAKSLSVLEGQFESCAYMKIRKLVHFRVHGPCRRCSIFFIFLYFPAEPVFSEVYLRPTKVEDIILGCLLAAERLLRREKEWEERELTIEEAKEEQAGWKKRRGGENVTFSSSPVTFIYTQSLTKCSALVKSA